ncbi:oxidoreductase [Novosphingobium sp. SL115]|uniref:GPW/gp25 family protein n=1 Tax=Novosphingobium sp. SL115 TaxID=2995150 RepID=UPI00227676EF|nr:GPW/gp25 family protein [Novosphingobium sp. SL115]MCY1672126.1 oxidoreductase [Novosphingobium sp. SL115]
MDPLTGKAISGPARRALSIARIITTPLGTCVMRREFGSMVYELIDRPLNVATAMLLRAATAIAIRRWETAFRITRITLSGDFAGGAPVIGIEGYDLDAPDPTALVTLSIPIRRAATTAPAS